MLLDTADDLAREAIAVEARLLVAAAQWAVLSGPEAVDPRDRGLPGRGPGRVGLRRTVGCAPGDGDGDPGQPRPRGPAAGRLRRLEGPPQDPDPDPDPDPEPPVIDWRDLLPKVELCAHLYAGEDPTGIARVEGIGAVTEAWVREVLGPRATITHGTAIDLAGQAPVDAWEVPDRHRRAVRLITPADTFPFATATVNQTDRWPAMQIDHAVPWPDGPFAVGNHGPLTIRHHNLKTHGHWHVAQPLPGIYLWRDPHGQLYLVDHTGTRGLRLDDAA